MKNGGTPLHWASSREVLESLIERGCYINSLDFNGRTALHVMVSKNRLECVVSLLAHEAEIDLRDKDGNTALHIAVEKKFIPIVQCLVVFGCDIDAKNKQEQSSRHMVGKDASGSDDDMILYILHSVGARRCPELSVKCPPGCNFKGSYNGIPPAQPETSEQREHIQEMLASTTAQLARGRASLPNIISQQLKLHHPPTPIDTTAEQRGASVMDALLSMFTTKVQAATKETSVADKGTSTTEDVDEEISMEDEESPVSEEDAGVPIGRGRLLCLDGGGIRGLVLVQMLLEVEQLAQCPINHLFDWVSFKGAVQPQSRFYVISSAPPGRWNLDGRHIGARDRRWKDDEAVLVPVSANERHGVRRLAALLKRSAGECAQGKPRRVHGDVGDQAPEDHGHGCHG